MAQKKWANNLELVESRTGVGGEVLLLEVIRSIRGRYTVSGAWLIGSLTWDNRVTRGKGSVTVSLSDTH